MPYAMNCLFASYVLRKNDNYLTFFESGRQKIPFNLGNLPEGQNYDDISGKAQLFPLPFFIVMVDDGNSRKCYCAACISSGFRYPGHGGYDQKHFRCFEAEGGIPG